MVFDIQANEVCAFNFFGARLFIVSKIVLQFKTWLEHCILAEVGVCYRSVGEVKTVRAWEASGKQTEDVTATAGQSATADFTL